ncbi:MAG: hypothetical protein EAX90_03200 [Candidatus Heimdallarchaeota archaeon]|nr:hypothetical protein [Candidatus Heimdallarchaeota archaeon]
MKKTTKLLTVFILSSLMMVSISAVSVIAISMSDADEYAFELDSLDESLATRATYYYEFINPQPGDTVSGYVSIRLQATYDGYTLYRVRIRLYKDSVGITSYYDMTHEGNNIWQINWDTENYDDGSGYSLRFILYRSSYRYASLYCNDITVDNSGGIPPPPPPPPEEGEKIAVFFWATDAGTESVINKYINYLQSEGYTKFFKFEDSYNVQSDCQTVDNYEDSDDTIFVYIIGHGNNDGYHSYTAFRPSASIVYSNTFRSWMDLWEAPQKCILVESCHSGDWADDFANSPYLAMSTSDETHLSYALGTLPGEGKFSYYFFNYVQSGHNAVDSFNYAKSYCSNQYPKIRDYSSYVWFVN